MFAQGVLGGSARDAGAALIPMMLGWPLASGLSGRLMLRYGYRPLIRFGGVVSVVGLAALAYGPASSLNTGIAMATIGFGMGFLATPYLVSVQNAVPWNRRGVVTSSNHFFRTIGGSIMVAVLGAVLNAQLRGRLGSHASASQALQPVLNGHDAASAVLPIRQALRLGLHSIFTICLALGVVLLIIGLFFPGGAASEHAHDAAAA
jgi:MFS family permease